MTVVRRLLRAELVKITSTRVTWALFAGAVALTLGLVALQIGGLSAKALHGDVGLRKVLPLAGSAATPFALALGVVGMAGEYRHGSIAQAMLAAPRRWQIVVAKLIAYSLAGLVLGAVCVVAAYALAGPWLDAKHAGFGIGDSLPLEIAVGSILGSAMVAAIGVGLGAVLKDQVAALLVGIGWTLVIDTVATSAAPGVGKFFPGGAEAALMREQSQDLLPMGAGGLVLLAYVALFAVAGTYLIRRRDLT